MLLLLRQQEVRGTGPVNCMHSWQENDGLVNTVSAMVPVGAPSKAFEKRDIRTGMWNVFPVLTGDHMWLQGGLLKKHNIRKFYMRLLGLIEGLPTVPDEKTPA